MCSWFGTTGRLRDHMEVETGINVSAGWLRERMKKLGFVFRRPKKDLRHLQDPQPARCGGRMAERG